MIVKFGEQRLWVEGDVAYSIDDIKAKHAKLTTNKNELETNLSAVNAEIEDASARKSKLESDLINTNCELNGIDVILTKILNAETTPAVTEVPLTANVASKVATPDEVASVVTPKRNIRIID